MSWRLLACTATLLLVATSCSTSGPLPTGEFVRVPSTKYWSFKDLARITPEPEYREWFRETSFCLKLPANFEKIYWYAASEARDPYDAKLNGLYWPINKGSEDEPRYGHAIVLIKRSEDTVRHEIAHFIMRENDVERHHWRLDFWACIRVKD